MNPPARVDDIDWSVWTPVDPATLVFVVRGEQVLLIRKKRGLGAGKINGPGGRLEAGEMPLECAVREVREELGVTPVGLAYAGENSFQFVDGYSIHVHVYRADDCDGTPVETDEAVPHWFHVEQIPYDEMWADDILWVPLVLRREKFLGRFLFDGDRMLDHRVEILP